jgi:hypothetical protein
LRQRAARQLHWFNIPFDVALESKFSAFKTDEGIFESGAAEIFNEPVSSASRNQQRTIQNQRRTNLNQAEINFQSKEGANDATQGERGVAGRSEERQGYDFDG